MARFASLAPWRGKALGCLLLSVSLLAVRPADAGDPVTADRLRGIVGEQQQFYEQTFPDLSFVVLRNGPGGVNELERLIAQLGREPTNLDYEHPEKLRELLTEVSLERIRLMLFNQIPSATLFRPGPAAQAEKDVCVLTLSGCPISSEGDVMSRFMLELTEEELAGIPEDLRLDCEAYLAFAFDHEVYHCLSSLYEGPQPMSFEDLWGEYWHFRQEQGADAYAMARHLQRYRGHTIFADKLRLARGMGLYDGDVDHWTCAALDRVFERSPEQHVDAPAAELLRKAGRIRDEIVPDYEAYLVYRRAAIEAMARLGVDGEILEEARRLLPEGAYDPAMVAALVDESLRCEGESPQARRPGELQLELRGD